MNKYYCEICQDQIPEKYECAGINLKVLEHPLNKYFSHKSTRGKLSQNEFRSYHKADFLISFIKFLNDTFIHKNVAKEGRFRAPEYDTYSLRCLPKSLQNRTWVCVQCLVNSVYTVENFNTVLTKLIRYTRYTNNLSSVFFFNSKTEYDRATYKTTYTYIPTQIDSKGRLVLNDKFIDGCYDLFKGITPELLGTASNPETPTNLLNELVLFAPEAVAANPNASTEALKLLNQIYPEVVKNNPGYSLITLLDPVAAEQIELDGFQAALRAKIKAVPRDKFQLTMDRITLFCLDLLKEVDLAEVEILNGFSLAEFCKTTSATKNNVTEFKLAIRLINSAIKLKHKKTMDKSLQNFLEKLEQIVYTFEDSSSFREDLYNYLQSLINNYSLKGWTKLHAANEIISLI